MAKVFIEETTLSGIGDAIRTKRETTELIPVVDMASEILAIDQGSDIELPTLTNPGTAADVLAGKEVIGQAGNLITGTIATKTSSDLTVSGATVTVPAGHYASQATKSVATAARAKTTITTIADDTNDKLTITASNDQSTGYVTGSNETASTIISLTASGATVTASDGANSVSKSVVTATQATPSVNIDSTGKITASVTQTTGYVDGGTKTATKQLTTQGAKTITPSTSSQTAVAKDVYTTGVITVGAIPSDYITTTDADATASDILSGKTAYVDGEKITGTIATKTSSNLTASGATVTVPAGYYASQATKSVTTATQATPSVSINSAGKITATATQTAGYVSAGTKSGTKQLTVQAAKTITPSTSSQTAVAKNVYTTGVVTVGAIPSNYIIPSGTKTVTTNGTHDVTSYKSVAVNVTSISTGSITINVESGSTVTCKKGSTTKTATSTGTVVFEGLAFGTWTITATKGSATTTQTVELGYPEIDMYYSLTLYDSGDVAASSGGWSTITLDGTNALTTSTYLGVINVRAQAGGYGLYLTNNIIDVSGFSTLTYTCGKGGDGTAQVVLIPANATSISQAVASKEVTVYNNQPTAVDTLDISALTGKYRIGLSLKPMYTNSILNIYMKYMHLD